MGPYAFWNRKHHHRRTSTNFPWSLPFQRPPAADPFTASNFSITLSPPSLQSIVMRTVSQLFFADHNVLLQPEYVHQIRCHVKQWPTRVPLVLDRLHIPHRGSHRFVRGIVAGGSRGTQGGAGCLRSALRGCRGVVFRHQSS